VKIINYIFFFRCLHYYRSRAKALEIHAVDCEKQNDCAIRLPSENNKWLSFNNYIRKEHIPIFMIYADLECTLEKMQVDMETFTYQHHRIFSILCPLFIQRFIVQVSIAVMIASYDSLRNLKI